MYKVAVLGASGAVGREMIETLEQRAFPIEELRLLASPRSAGSRIPAFGKLNEVQAVEKSSFDGVDVALFSAGGSVSAEWGPIAASAGAVVIDNTSHFRMDPDVPLVVPEVNGHLLEARPSKGIIANPNCSTIQMVQVLAPLHERFTLKRVVVATYQSVSGKGAKAIEETEEQSLAVLEGVPFEPREFPHQIAFNVLPHIDSFLENGYTKEEMKMVNETRRIIGSEEIALTATCVRVPVFRAHSEAVNCEFAEEAPADEVRRILSAAENVVVVDNPSRDEYPLPVYAEGRDQTYVGRIRQDISVAGNRAVDLWIVSDNLRKGAALNAVQIAEKLHRNGVLGTR